jgi:hypothetical protein
MNLVFAALDVLIVAAAILIAVARMRLMGGMPSLESRGAIGLAQEAPWRGVFRPLGQPFKSAPR